VGNDNCMRYEGRVLQISKQAHRRNYAKAQVRVHEYPDSALAVFLGPRLLVRFPAGGACEVKGAPTHPASARARGPL
jgi:hypothetical protein